MFLSVIKGERLQKEWSFLLNYQIIRYLSINKEITFLSFIQFTIFLSNTRKIKSMYLYNLDERYINFNEKRGFLGIKCYEQMQGCRNPDF